MKTIQIFSRNDIFQKFTVLKTNRNKRRRYGEFIAEGVRNINEAVRNGWKINAFLFTNDKPLSSWAVNLLETVPTVSNYLLGGGLMSELSGKEDASELLAVIQMKDGQWAADSSDNANTPLGYPASPDSVLGSSPNPVLALFDRPSNKGNLGTMLRSCDALGVEGLIITGHAVDIYDPDVISASMGSFFSVPFVRLSDNADIDAYLNGLKAKYAGLKIIGTTSHNRQSIDQADMTPPVLLCVGSETDGLNRHITEACDALASIPMSETSSASSFNVSCAATVMFYEANRQRQFLKRQSTGAVAP